MAPGQMNRLVLGRSIESNTGNFDMIWTISYGNRNQLKKNSHRTILVDFPKIFIENHVALNFQIEIFQNVALNILKLYFSCF